MLSRKQTFLAKASVAICVYVGCAPFALLVKHILLHLSNGSCSSVSASLMLWDYCWILRASFFILKAKVGVVGKMFFNYWLFPSIFVPKYSKQRSWLWMFLGLTWRDQTFCLLHLVKQITEIPGNWDTLYNERKREKRGTWLRKYGMKKLRWRYCRRQMKRYLCVFLCSLVVHIQWRGFSVSWSHQALRMCWWCECVLSQVRQHFLLGQAWWVSMCQPRHQCY